MRVRWLPFLTLALCLMAAAQQEPPATSPGQPATPNVEAPGAAPIPAPMPDLTPDAAGALSQAQMFRVVGDKDRENQRRLRDYTYIEREVENTLGGDGQTKSTEIKKFEILDVSAQLVANGLKVGLKLLGHILFQPVERLDVKARVSQRLS